MWHVEERRMKIQTRRKENETKGWAAPATEEKAADLAHSFLREREKKNGRKPDSWKRKRITQRRETGNRRPIKKKT